MLMMMLQVALAASVADLAEVARTGSDPEAQGEAVLALSQRTDPQASRALDQLYTSREVSTLVRTWAGAARIQQATTAQEVLRYTSHLSELPALIRPIQLQLAALPADGEAVDQGLMLMLSPDLAEAIAPSLLAQPAEDLVAAMLTHDSDGARRIAAGLLATRGATDSGVAEAVVAQLSWQESEALPWEGGALFVPGLDWHAREARALVEALIGWHVYCDRMGLSAEKQQLTNNLRSVSLLQAAGITPRGASTSREWLVLLGRAHGPAAIDRVLAPQGMERQYAITLE